MTDDLRNNVTRGQTWQRLLFILLFAFIYTVAEIVIAAVVVLQFGFELIAGKRNRNLLDLGASLSRYAYEILLYVTYNSDRRPFPFSDWPEEARPKAAARKGSRASGTGSTRKTRSRGASDTATRGTPSDETSPR
ncbi:MAG: DUF4389 domain-containing protein [Gammaproteobacteria bacterium]|nr:DUF4389 domain-containing protein [Gammaproteobacteria bacterium]NIR84507.1 DUF4389 domain-containing protein [Gammaproteobacteria bacterium]NIR90410.1 DUF4389 domain-containing protein [Gammaproteobacteria bacterium]NIU05558.1 DUF4389 domain-containing protein [Gammaproteobacteria bacterium]NIV52697.1 DUF4389 domain-containing protein [Gammaproteobacteria bacterium]